MCFTEPSPADTELVTQHSHRKARGEHLVRRVKSHSEPCLYDLHQERMGMKAKADITHMVKSPSLLRFFQKGMDKAKRKTLLI